jgi:pimeloyl-ACP methyl ester carboxylesterase
MNKVTSKDGTEIAYDKRGEGQVVILVDGAMTYRSFGPSTRLAELLAGDFTVYNYDRRGRGESSDTLPYSVEREVEDLDALIAESGGVANVYGISSGASLALEAAARLGDRIKKLAMYEAPYNADPSAQGSWREYRRQLTQYLTENRRGDAVARFMQQVGASNDQVEGMRHAPVWPMFEAIAPTLAYDAAILGEGGSPPIALAAKVSTPALVLNGTDLAFMQNTAQMLANAMQQAQHLTLEGQTHDVNPEVLAPVLIKFFKS